MSSRRDSEGWDVICGGGCPDRHVRVHETVQDTAASVLTATTATATAKLSNAVTKESSREPHSHIDEQEAGGAWARSNRQGRAGMLGHGAPQRPAAAALPAVEHTVAALSVCAAEHAVAVAVPPFTDTSYPPPAVMLLAVLLLVGGLHICWRAYTEGATCSNGRIASLACQLRAVLAAAVYAKLIRHSYRPSTVGNAISALLLFDLYQLYQTCRKTDRTTTHCTNGNDAGRVAPQTRHSVPHAHARTKTCAPTDETTVAVDTIKEHAERDQRKEDAGGGAGAGRPGASTSAPASLLPAEAQKSVMRMRQVLEADTPVDATVYTDTYLHAVMCAPSKKDPSMPRSFEYARQKLLAAISWRVQHKPEALTPAMLHTTLKAGSLYWHGYDNLRRPILWVQPHLKDWKNLDINSEVKMHTFMVEFGLKHMPKGVDTFCIVANTSHLSMSQFRLKLGMALLNIIMKCYPDRMGAVYAGPLNMAVHGIYALLSPFMPRNLVSKIHLMKKPRETLPTLLGGADKVPDFLGGVCKHTLSALPSDTTDDAELPAGGKGGKGAGATFTWDTVAANVRHDLDHFSETAEVCQVSRVPSSM